MAEKARVIDVTKCIACRGCQTACKNWNQLPAVQTEFTGSYENPPDLTSETWGRLMFREHGELQDMKWYFCFYSCMHCEDPACLPVCPVDAITITSLGSVRIDQETCIGCGLCVTACPFEVPRLDGVPKAWKCTMCFDRISNGMSTACAKACPTGTITYGDASDKLKEAEDRVDALKVMGYDNAQIYGKDEVGGTHVYYVLADSPDKYGLIVDPQVSLSTYFWNVALAPIKTLAAVGLTVGFMNEFIKKKAVQMEKKNLNEKDLVE